jgi:signal transduction histidine kinase
VDLQVRGDRNRLQMVFWNLLRNGFEATGGKGEIVVSADTEDHRVRIAFGDNGPGIPEAIRQRLFEPGATHGKAHGHGFGLYVSRQVVRAHRGELFVDTGRIAGTVFVVDLPAPDTTDVDSPDLRTSA